jgi:glycosyltransferase involved in cell wall biosynthesis
MKILLLSQWFDPESCFKGLAFAREIRRQGHEVMVLTGFPNYPGGKIYPGYRVRLWQRETMDGIAVLRVPLYPSHDRSALRRILNYLSFSLAAAIGIFALPKPDVVYVYSPPPTTALAAVMLRAVKRVPFVLDIQDMWPDTLTATGMVRHAGLLSTVGWWMRFIYRRAARIAVLSPGFKRLLADRGVAADRVAVIPNWTHEDVSSDASPPESRRHFNIVYAGNIGAAQGLETVLAAAEVLRDAAPQVRFLIAGDGVDADALRADAVVRQLDNVSFLGRLPATEMPALFARASALLVHLRDEPIFTTTIPSKTQAYLRAGKPILIGMRGDAAALVEEAGAGIAFEPGNDAALTAAILQLAALPRQERAAMGKAGSEYYRRHLSLEAGTKRFISLFEEVLAKAGTGSSLRSIAAVDRD